MKYDPILYPKLAGEYARKGLIDIEIAQKLGINVATLYRWKNKFCEFCEALKRNKLIADIEVEQALYKRACGYNYEIVKVKVLATKTITKNDETIEVQSIMIQVTQKHEPPDIRACMYWLNNRASEYWSSKPGTSKSYNAPPLRIAEVAPAKDMLAEDEVKYLNTDNADVLSIPSSLQLSALSSGMLIK